MYGHGTRCSPVGCSPVPADLAQQVVGEPAGQVEEVEVLHLGGQPADLAGERDEQRPAHLRLLVEERLEGIAPKDEGRHGVEGDRGRRPRRAVEQRQLPEEPARADGRQDRRVGPVVRRDHDLHRAAGHDEQRVARVVDVEDDLAASEAAGPHRGRAAVERGVLDPGEEAAGPERLPARRSAPAVLVSTAASGPRAAIRTAGRDASDRRR